MVKNSPRVKVTERILPDFLPEHILHILIIYNDVQNFQLMKCNLEKVFVIFSYLLFVCNSWR